MVRYKLNLSRTVSRIIPKALRNSKTYQWIISITFPLNKVNGNFVGFATEKKRFSEISSQTLILESFLNETFSKYFPDPEKDFISIAHGFEISSDTYDLSEIPPANPPYNSGHLISYNRLEIPPPTKSTKSIYFDYEDIGLLPEDFRLILPPSIQSDLGVVSRIKSIVDRYVVDTKKYDVVYG